MTNTITEIKHKSFQLNTSIQKKLWIDMMYILYSTD